MDSPFKNKNRGYQQLRVWDDAIDYWIDHLVLKESNVAYGSTPE